MRKLLYCSIATLILFSFLLISCSENIQDSQDVIKEAQPNLEMFAQSTDFKNLVNTSKKIIKIHSNYFQSIPKKKKLSYIKGLDNLTKNLKENPTKRNLIKFIRHTGFEDLNQFIKLYDKQNKEKRHLSERFPKYANLNQSEKKIFLRKVALVGRKENGKLDSDDITISSCSSERSAKRRGIEAESYLELLGCGAAAGAATTAAGPFAGAAVYGFCAGAVYSKRDADLELAQSEYEDCIE